LEIKIKEGAKLPRARQRMFTREEALEVKRQQKNDGKIRESDSSVSTLFMAKADGSKRLCMNMRPSYTARGSNKIDLHQPTVPSYNANNQGSQ